MYIHDFYTQHFAYHNICVPSFITISPKAGKLLSGQKKDEGTDRLKPSIHTHPTYLQGGGGYGALANAWVLQ